MRALRRNVLQKSEKPKPGPPSQGKKQIVLFQTWAMFSLTWGMAGAWGDTNFLDGFPVLVNGGECEVAPSRGVGKRNRDEF